MLNNEKRRICALRGSKNFSIFDMPLYKRLQVSVQSIALWMGMPEEVLKLHRENAATNTIHQWLQLWQGAPRYPNRGKELNLEMLKFKQHELIKNLQTIWREPGWQDSRRASRERREKAIQLNRQMDVIPDNISHQVDRVWRLYKVWHYTAVKTKSEFILQN